MALIQSYESRSKQLLNISEMVKRINDINRTTHRYTKDAVKHGIPFSEIQQVAEDRLSEVEDLFLVLKLEFDNINWTHQHIISRNPLLEDFTFTSNNYSVWNGQEPSDTMYFLEFSGQQAFWDLFLLDDKWVLEDIPNHYIFEVQSDPTSGTTGGTILSNKWSADTTGWSGFSTDWVREVDGDDVWAEHQTGNTTALSQEIVDQNNSGLSEGQVGVLPIEIDYGDAITPAGSFTLIYGFTWAQFSSDDSGLFYVYMRGYAGGSVFYILPSSDFNGRIRFVGEKEGESIDLGKRIPAVQARFISPNADFSPSRSATLRLLER